jgi:hypothetical protein
LSTKAAHRSVRSCRCPVHSHADERVRPSRTCRRTRSQACWKRNATQRL